MSVDLTIGKRYAKALFELAQQQNQIDRIESELKAVVALFEGDAKDFFQHPSIGIEDKFAVLKKALEGQISETLYDTLRLIVERRRQTALDAILTHYVRLANQARGRATAIVYTPIALSETEQNKIADYFGKVIGKQIQVENVIKPELLGGLQVRIGDRLYDGSLSGKLAGLKKLLA